MSGAPLILDRKEAKNGNSFIIAKPGAGKSMHAKIEINNVLFSTHLDQVIAIDPEREFVELCRAHGGRGSCCYFHLHKRNISILWCFEH